MRSQYENQRFSILGDSISTLQGWNPPNYSLYYTGSVCARSGVRDAADTWWGMVLAELGGKLLVNNAWSGSRVTAQRDRGGLFPAGCSDERTAGLHTSEAWPDVIIVYLGVNDWSNGVSIGSEETRLLAPIHFDSFDEAYEAMVSKLRTNYPGAELWCCTLPRTFVSANPDFVFPESFAGQHIERYNDVIRQTARDPHVRILDLYGADCKYDTMDGIHPTVRGMRQLANAILSLVRAETSDLSDEQPDRFQTEAFLPPPTELLSDTGVLPMSAVRAAAPSGGRPRRLRVLPQSQTDCFLDRSDSLFLFSYGCCEFQLLERSGCKYRFLRRFAYCPVPGQSPRVPCRGEYFDASGKLPEALTELLKYSLANSALGQLAAGEDRPPDPRSGDQLVLLSAAPSIRIRTNGTGCPLLLDPACALALRELSIQLNALFSLFQQGGG